MEILACYYCGESPARLVVVPTKITPDRAWVEVDMCFGHMDIFVQNLLKLNSDLKDGTNGILANEEALKAMGEKKE